MVVSPCRIAILPASAVTMEVVASLFPNWPHQLVRSRSVLYLQPYSKHSTKHYALARVIVHGSNKAIVKHVEK